MPAEKPKSAFVKVSISLPRKLAVAARKRATAQKRTFSNHFQVLASRDLEAATSR